MIWRLMRIDHRSIPPRWYCTFDANACCCQGLSVMIRNVGSDAMRPASPHPLHTHRHTQNPLDFPLLVPPSYSLLTAARNTKQPSSIQSIPCHLYLCRANFCPGHTPVVPIPQSLLNHFCKVSMFDISFSQTNQQTDQPSVILTGMYITCNLTQCHDARITASLPVRSAMPLCGPRSLACIHIYIDACWGRHMHQKYILKLANKTNAKAQGCVEINDDYKNEQRCCNCCCCTAWKNDVSHAS